MTLGGSPGRWSSCSWPFGPRRPSLHPSDPDAPQPPSFLIDPPDRTSYPSRAGVLRLRLDVLVDAEEVVRVVRRLDLRQAVVVIAVAGADSLLTLVHHHVHVG